MRWEANGDSRTVDLLPDGRVRVDDRIYMVEAQRLADGGWLLRINGQRWLAYSAAWRGEQHIHLDGQTFTLTGAQTRPARRAASAPGDLRAQMPGQVRAVHVAEGDLVEAGQTLVILEAMKMELRVTAPAAGVVKRLLVQAGDVVERGQMLAEVISDDTP